MTLLLLALAGQVYAEDYRIVLGSFLDTKNAVRFIETLGKAGYRVDTETAVSNDRIFTRVCIADRYGTWKDAAAALAKLRNTSFFRGAAGKDLWIRNPALAPAGPVTKKSFAGKIAPAGVPTLPVPLVAAPPAASIPELPLTAAPPGLTALPAAQAIAVPELPPVRITRSQKTFMAGKYSSDILNGPNGAVLLDDHHPTGIRVARFETSSDAERALAILEGLNLEPYTLKTYDPAAGISFDVLVGSFNDSVDAGPMFERLMNEGIGFPEIVTWKDKKPFMDAYDGLADRERTETGFREPFLNVVPRDAIRLVSECPVPPDMRIISLMLVDQRRRPAEEGFPSAPDFTLENKNPGAGWSLAVVLAGLLDESVITIETFFASEEASSFYRRLETLEPGAGIVKTRLEWNDRKIMGVSFRPVDVLEKWYAWDERNSQGWSVSGTPERVRAYLESTYRETPADCESLVKSFTVLPEDTAVNLRSFCFGVRADGRSNEENVAADSFELNEVWKASAFFDTPDGPLAVSVFDLNFPVIVDRAIEILTAEIGTGSGTSGTSRFIDMPSGKAWYSEPESGADMNDLFLINGTLVTALNSFPGRLMNAEKLRDWALKLGTR